MTEKEVSKQDKIEKVEQNMKLGEDELTTALSKLENKGGITPIEMRELTFNQIKAAIDKFASGMGERWKVEVDELQSEFATTPYIADEERSQLISLKKEFFSGSKKIISRMERKLKELEKQVDAIITKPYGKSSFIPFL